MSELYTDGVPPTNENVVPPVAPPALPDEAAALIGPGKKYATVEAALAALPHAQQHISRLEAENGELRNVSAKTQTVEEVYAAVKELLTKEGVPAAKGLDEASVAGLFDSRFQAFEAERVAKTNESSFKAVMTEQFGDKQSEVFSAKAGELGLTTKELSDMVRKSPVAALRLMGVEGGKGVRKPLSSDVNTEALALNPVRKPDHKNVMQGSTTKDLVDAWRRAAPPTQ